MKKTNFVLGALVMILASALVFTGCNPQASETTAGDYDTNGSGNTYTVTFDSNGGSEVTSVKVKKGEVVDEPTAPTKTGYDLVGWYNGETVYDFTLPVTDDLSLKASWSAIEYSITYDVGEGVNAAENPAKYTIESEDITLAAATGPESTPNFVAWHIDSAEGDKVTGVAIAKGTTGDKKFVAEYSAKAVYVVTLKTADGTEVATVNVVEGEKVTVPTISGKTIDGLYTDAEMTTAFDTETIISSNTTIYVKVSAVKITVTFDVDGTLTTQEVEYGSKATKIDDPVKDGYTFKGWYVGDTAYDFESAVKEAVTLTAKWEKVVSKNYTYVIENKTIDFALNGENNYQVVLDGLIPADVVLNKGDSVEITLKAKSNIAVTNLSAFIVDNTKDAGWWKVISGYGAFADSVNADEDFEYTVTLSIKEKQVGTGAAAHKIALYYDLSVGEAASLYPQGTNLSAGPVAKDLISAPQSKCGGMNITTLEAIEALITDGYTKMTVTMENTSGESRDSWGILVPISADAEDPWAWHQLKAASGETLETTIGTVSEWGQLTGVTFDNNEATYSWTLENVKSYMIAAAGSCDKKHQFTLQSSNNCIIKSVIVSAE